jgi:NRPS condensation-like uncharacterized protein
MDRGLLSWRVLGILEGMIQLEMVFDARLDADRLARASDLLLDAQPVLGCGMAPHPRRPYWQRLDTSSRKNFHLIFDAGEYENFKNSTMDVFAGPQAVICLLRAGAGDRLLLKVSHEVSDAGGVKEVAADLCGIYNRLAEQPDFVPEPNVGGSRSSRQIMKKLPWRSYPTIMLDAVREMRDVTFPLATHAIPVPACPDKQIGFVVRHIQRERVTRLAEYGRARGATLNDMFVAAAFRAMAAAGDWDGKSQLRLTITFDLRRWYLQNGRPGGICNLSSFEFPNLGANLGKDFEETLSRVSLQLRRRKSRFPGMPRASWISFFHIMSYSRLEGFFDRIMKITVKHRNFSDAFTNMGRIVPEDITFQGQSPAAAWLLTPAAYPPLFAFGMSGFAKTITLSSGAPAPCLGIAEAVLDGIIAELPE